MVRIVAGRMFVGRGFSHDIKTQLKATLPFGGLFTEPSRIARAANRSKDNHLFRGEVISSAKRLRNLRSSNLDTYLRNMRRYLKVRIITQKKLREAYKKHPEWEASLVSWRRIVRGATWSNFSDVKQSWSNVDIVDSRVVFNIGHNKCRLIAFIGYRIHAVFVLHLLTHAEYDKGAWKNDRH